MENRCLEECVVLYVEDDAGIRNQIAHFLTHRCASLFLAENGRDALELFHTKRPDIVISDILMPEMDGLELAKSIKETSQTTPIIITTAFNDSDYLLRAIGIGIDEYVLKPVDLERLLYALHKQAEILCHARAFIAHKAQLEAYHHSVEEERGLVANLMRRMMRPERLTDPQIKYWLQPTEVVGGDLLAVARSRNDRLYVMLADSTGHGLPAALNLLPVNHIFYSMVSKSLPVSLIVEEMNWAVKEQSPTERFVAALVVCIDNRNHVIELWNGGIPKALVFDSSGDISYAFKLGDLPLGVLDSTFAAQTEIFQWHEQSQLVIYSDGISEAENENGEPFGDIGLINAIKDAPAGERFEGLRVAVNKHLGVRHALDDMSLLIVDCPFNLRG